MNSPQVSVIIPAYNQGHYLAEAINSVLNQTYYDYEVVVVDDGSTDNTPQVAKSFSDSRICYVYQENRGLSAARNTGIHHARGTMVTFLDSDDLFLPEKLALLVHELQSNPEVGFVAGQAVLIDENGQRLSMLNGSLPDDNAQLLLGNPLHVGSVMVRRSWLDRVGLFDESLRACEDWDMWLRLSKIDCPMRWVSQPVSLYRVHPEQMTRGAERMRTAAFAVLSKTFSYPDLPETWRNLKERAYAVAYVKAAARAYHAGAYAEAKRDLAEAVNWNPKLLDDEAEQLAQQLAGWARAPRAKDPLGYLERVYRNLPDKLSSLRRQRRRDLARMAAQMASEYYEQGDLPKARSLFFRALRYQPQWLKNRGTLSAAIRLYLELSL